MISFSAYVNPIGAEDESGLDRVLEECAVEPADRGHDDVVEVLLAAAVALHRVVAKLERRDVRLAVCPAHDLVDRLLDRERARLDELGPVVEGQELIEGLALALADRDEVDEVPVVLHRETDPLLVCDAPEPCRIDRTAEMHVQLGQLIAEGVRQV